MPMNGLGRQSNFFHFPFLSLILDYGTFHASQLIFAEVLIQRIWQRESQTFFYQSEGKAMTYIYNNLLVS